MRTGVEISRGNTVLEMNRIPTRSQGLMAHLIDLSAMNN